MTVASIEVRNTGGDPLVFSVAVKEAGRQTQHTVTVSRDFAGQFVQPPEQLVEAAFRFLLDRESKESILSRFDISVIARYFPEFPHKLPVYLARD